MTAVDNSTPGRIRTCDLRFRRPLLYPTELQGQTLVFQCLSRLLSVPAHCVGTRNETQPRECHENDTHAAADGRGSDTASRLHAKGDAMAKSIRKSHQKKSPKPYDGFPLMADTATNRWCENYRGKRYDFGRLAGCRRRRESANPSGHDPTGRQGRAKTRHSAHRVQPTRYANPAAEEHCGKHGIHLRIVTRLTDMKPFTPAAISSPQNGWF
jgi:hypothetical protein